MQLYLSLIILFDISLQNLTYFIFTIVNTPGSYYNPSHFKFEYFIRSEVFIWI